MTTHLQAINSTKDILAYRQANAKHIKDNNSNQQVREYYRGFADGFAESLMVLQRECDNAYARPQAQASVQLAPGRLIIRVGTRIFDIRDIAMGMVAASKIIYLYANCENAEDCYCINCDAAALEALANMPGLTD